MAEVVPATEVEQIVGAKRGILHKARVTTEWTRRWGWVPKTTYVLHSISCFEHHNLLVCAYTRALDRGQDDWAWSGWLDEPVVVQIVSDRGVERLVPVARCTR